MTTLLRLVARALDALMAPPAWTFESSWPPERDSTPRRDRAAVVTPRSTAVLDSRRGGESRTPTPLAVQANRPGGCNTSP